MRRPAILLALVLTLALPALASAQSSPFTPLPTAPQDQAPAPVITPPSNASGGNGGLTGGAKLGLLLAGAALIVGISWIIVRDARRSAPRRRMGRGTEPGRPPVPKPPAAPGARGRPTGRGGAERKRARKRAKTR